MIIKSLEHMETIVKKNKFLHWEGWDVVELKKTHAARTAKDGVYYKGQWFIKKIYSANRQGWDVPNKFGG